MSDAPAMFELWAGPHEGRTLTVVSFTGREAISKLFSFEVLVLAAAELELGDGKLLGEPATLVIRTSERVARVVQGLVAAVEPDGTSLRDGRRRHRIRVAPRFWLAKHRSGSRVFQDLTVPEIVTAVLDDLAIPRAWKLSREYPKRAYCVQYRESDHAFVTRLLAEEGILFYFDHPHDLPEGASATTLAETVTFLDEAALYPAIRAADEEAGAGVPALALRESRGMSDHDGDVQTFSLRTAVRAETTLLRDYDFRRPMLDLRAGAQLSPAAAESDAGALRAYVHRGDFDEPEVNPARAQVDLDRRRRKAIYARGTSTCRRLVPGHRFRLDAEAITELGRQYAVTRVEHEGRTPEWSQGGGGERPQIYSNRFECVPDDIAFRPRHKKRIVEQVLESAIVVGPPGEEIHTDGYGRIKVRFHWDISGAGGDRGSCWLRVVQAWAGASWGFQFIPRVGMEVMVTFLGGDPDCPVALGCAYNTTHPAPFALPESKTRSVLRTHSSPGGGGFNELRFEDQKGAEEVLIHAERDRTELVGRDFRTIVGGDDRREIKGDRSLKVSGDGLAIVEGNYKDSVAGDREESTGGQHTSASRGGKSDKIGGDLALTVGGAETRSIGGSSNVTVAKDSRTQIGGRHEVRVGSKDEEGAALGIKGDYKIDATGRFELKADKGILLKCGETILEVTPQLIRLLSESLVLAGSKSTALSGKGPSVHLGEQLSLRADKVQVIADDSIEIKAEKTLRLTTPDASMKLDKEAAKLDGKVVKLNCKPEAPPKAKKDEAKKEDAPKPKPMVRVVAKDPSGKPYGRKPYTLKVDGATVGEGKTGDDGLVEHEVSESAQKGELKITIAEGRSLTLPLKIGKLDPVEQTTGLKARLQSLGFYHGPIDGNLDDDTKHAILAFQREAGLDGTGESDEVTQAKLMQMTHA